MATETLVGEFPGGAGKDNKPRSKPLASHHASGASKATATTKSNGKSKTPANAKSKLAFTTIAIRSIKSLIATLRRRFARLGKSAKRIVVAIAIVMLGFVGFNLLVATAPTKPLQPRQEQIWTVEGAVVVFADASPLQASFGQVEATRKSDLGFTIAGEVAHVADVFRNGELVEKGETLARLDDELLLISRDANAAMVEELTTQLRLRQQQFDRIQSMHEAAVVPQARLDEAELALSIAKNALEQARLQLRLAERNLVDSVLTAPFDGVVSEVNIGQGQIVSPAARLGRITDIASLEVAFVVPSEVFITAQSLIGGEVEVVWQSGGRAITSTTARIRHAEGNVDSSEGGGRLYAALPPSQVNVAGSHPAIPEGAFVEVRYSAGTVSQVARL
ncbi:MAG: efflux RND transporter periplasmic adaptor subunit, partial [Proteobacteria bacterium]|nr:efflux RND transporter periplasmic adaptor subunit [Pseudomonadota bacterium]